MALIVGFGVRHKLVRSQKLYAVLGFHVELLRSMVHCCFSDPLALEHLELVRFGSRTGCCAGQVLGLETLLQINIVLKVLVGLIYLCVFRAVLYSVRPVPALLMLHSRRYFPLCDLCVNSAVKAPEHLAEDLHRVAPQN